MHADVAVAVRAAVVLVRAERDDEVRVLARRAARAVPAVRVVVRRCGRRCQRRLDEGARKGG